ncbi:MAG: polysaccharide biosynthesis protein [Clostridia bacterium]|nr:polysaccharide biosynthesis protein [Clostridia bacterium]
MLKFDAPNMFKDWFDDNIIFIMLVDFVSTMFFFIIFKVYRRMWQYMVVNDYIQLARAFVLSKIVTVVPFFYIWLIPSEGPRQTRSFFTWMFLYSCLLISMVLFSRLLTLLGYRSWRKYLNSKIVNYKGKKKNVMIIGAGGTGMRIIEEFRNSLKYQNRYNVVALIDDNKRKHGEYLNGVKIYGGRDVIVKVAKERDVDEIFFAVSSADEKSKKEILEICSETGCVLKTLPSVTSVQKEESLSAKLRKVDYTDLLGREQIKPDLTKVFELLKDQTVFVSGGGGSIGSELVRQVAASGVAKTIIIFDIAENGAYEIQQEIRRNHPEVDLKVLIGSIRDEKRLCEIFETYKPDFVYHAAAHKHVPLMEDSPKEAVKNNVFGTFNLAKTADKYGVKRFVMISTDKAVNPTNVMGATKRICEMIVQSFNKKSDTEYVAVRFGNVLGSNGSVIPLFKEQIEKGGPVTVTHPDIIRYFMLIPEAVSLVLQAGAYANGGEIFILDMGSPVKIRELAENLIRLSGHVPGEDIEIKYTGLRDGEKLYEELLISEEGIQKTQNNLIYIARPMEFDSERLFKRIDYMREIMEGATGREIVDIVKELVPTFNPQNAAFKDEVEEVKEAAEEKEEIHV